jgi:hypothetical protein
MHRRYHFYVSLLLGGGWTGVDLLLLMSFFAPADVYFAPAEEDACTCLHGLCCLHFFVYTCTLRISRWRVPLFLIKCFLLRPLLPREGWLLPGSPALLEGPKSARMAPMGIQPRRRSSGGRPHFAGGARRKSDAIAKHTYAKFYIWRRRYI